MKFLFTYSKQQRIGIFLLLILILCLQIIRYFLLHKPHAIVNAINEDVYIKFREEVDSLRCLEEAKKTPRVYPFNPNFITDYKGYLLGMSTVEIDKLLAYRSQDKWINSAKEFQDVTGISDSLLVVISPYFKFPKFSKRTKIVYKNKISRDVVRKIDLNTATFKQLDAVYGIGKVLAHRILDYRVKHKGFVSFVELQEIYGLKPEVIARITAQFEIQNPRHITTLNVNTATVEELVTITYIDYEVAYHIVAYRTLHKGLKTLEELKNIESFPVEKYGIIELYLHLN